jgi:hypothetical protein
LLKNLLSTSPSSQLNPAIRRFALAGWILIVLAHLLLFVVDLAFDFSEMQVPCVGALGSSGTCNFLAISSAEVAVLSSWGLTMRAYAWAMLAPPVILLLVYWMLGGLILWRQGTSWLGLTVSLALITIPISMVSSDHDWSTSYPALAFFGVAVGLVGSVIMVLFLYLLPNGRFSPKWAYIPLFCTILLLFVLSLESNGIMTLSSQAVSLLNTTMTILVLLGGGLQIYRYRRDSNVTERQQTKWILSGILATVFAIIVWILVFGPALTIPAGQPQLLAYLGGWFLINTVLLLILPATITIAILRYNLWGIDVIIRKTLLYAALTALLALVYFGSIAVLQGVVTAVSGQSSSVAIVVSTLVIAALFAPLRRRLQDVIDRRFFRRKYDAGQVLARFAQTARDETDLDSLTTELTRVVQETMQPEQVSVWLKPTTDDRRQRTSA